jgi:hypothetical protein
LQETIRKKSAEFPLAGEFLFNYQDYYLEIPSVQVGEREENCFRLNSQGLHRLNRSPKSENDLPFKKTRTSKKEGPDIPASDFQSYLFLIVGIINFFIFLFIYRTFVDFRKNISRSIRRPHGFYVELLERRMIGHDQSFYLMIFIAFNAAVMLGGIIYFFKSHLLLDYLITLLIPFNELKFYISTVLWQPYLIILSIALFILLMLYLFAIPIQLFSFFSGSRIRWRQAVATSTWAASPFLLLIPFGLFFYNLLSVLNSYWILGAILLYFHVWYFLRWLNGTRVMAVSSYARVFIYAVALLTISLLGLYFLLYKDLNVLFHFKVIRQLFYLYT